MVTWRGLSATAVAAETLEAASSQPRETQHTTLAVFRLVIASNDQSSSKRVADIARSRRVAEAF
eukprot:4384781-Prymnesium_polylepis.1